MYKCLNCGKTIENEQIKEKVRCPYCGYKVVFKNPPKTVVKVQAK